MKRSVSYETNKTTDSRRSYWRSLEELAGSEEFERFVASEFPQQAGLLETSIDRRNFLKLMGASLALAGVNACTRQPTEKIIPYVEIPEQIVPGEPLYFATSMSLSGIATGVLAESHMGRPTKLEGNPEHPASLGATDLFAQASILELYDPGRTQTPLHLDASATGMLSRRRSLRCLRRRPHSEGRACDCSAAARPRRPSVG